MRVIIVGGGWSGIAAAVELSQHNCNVSLFEAGAALGGRARSVRWQNLNVDNGQHLMLGAYQQMLDLMHQIGIDINVVFDRQKIDLSIFDPQQKLLKISSRGLMPESVNQIFHLWRSSDFKTVLAVKRLQTSLKTTHYSDDLSVADLLHQTEQPPRLIRQLWEPLTLAMLNTPIAEASAAVFANVLKATLFAGGNATELLIPKVPLSEVLPAPASSFLRDHGAEIRVNNRIQSLLIENARVNGVVDQHGQPHFADAVILALPPSALIKLLPGSILQTTEYPICTVYLQYAASLRAPIAMTGFSGTVSQWLFDRSIQQPGLMAVVISGPGSHMQLTKNELIKLVSQELSDLLPDWPKTANSAMVIREKRATFACTSQIQKARPDCKTKIENLWLAGDFVQHPFPATLETAISNGRHCSQLILENIH